MRFRLDPLTCSRLENKTYSRQAILIKTAKTIIAIPTSGELLQLQMCLRKKNWDILDFISTLNLVLRLCTAADQSVTKLVKSQLDA